MSYNVLKIDIFFCEIKKFFFFFFGWIKTKKKTWYDETGRTFVSQNECTNRAARFLTAVVARCDCLNRGMLCNDCREKTRLDSRAERRNFDF